MSGQCITEQEGYNALLKIIAVLKISIERKSHKY
jgi:hypothetical protein